MSLSANASSPIPASSAPLLQAEGVTVRFDACERPFDVVRDVSFTLHPGRTLCLVGESGCGKSMTALSLLHISLPAPVITFSEVVSGANAFIAMLMMGVGFKISGDTSQKGKIVKILAVRYGVSIAVAAALYFFMPLPLEYRQALAILPLSPIASAAPAFTADLKGDFGLASAVNSISIVISIVLITATLLIIL